MMLVAVALLFAPNALLAQADDKKKVMLCVPGASCGPSDEHEGMCFDGHRISRIMMLPHNVYPDEGGCRTSGVFLHILLTDSGVRFFPRPLDVKPFSEHADYIMLQSGEGKGFEDALARIVSVTARRPLSKFVWDNEGDPDFNIFTVPADVADKARRDDPAYVVAQIYVPKSGEKILFWCVGENVTHPNGKCRVYDYNDRSNNHLTYWLRRANMKNWRRYSTWLWDYVDSVTVKEGR